MKTIVVFGATGFQGGSIAAALLQNGTFKVRAVTRNPKSSKAKELELKGAEVVKGDLNDKESISQALKNAYGCYLVTTWLEIDMGTEIQHGKNVADACKKENIHHLVFSTLPSVQKSLGFIVRHFDSKATIDDYMDSINLKRTRVMMSFYYQNFVRRFIKEGKNKFTYEMPIEGSSIPMISVDDLGQIVCKIFLDGDKYIGKSLAICAETLTVDKCFAIFNKYLEPKVVIDKKAKITDWLESTSSIQQDFAKFCKYLAKQPHKWDEELTKSIYPGVLSFEQWVITNKENIANTLDNLPLMYN